MVSLTAPDWANAVAARPSGPGEHDNAVQGFAELSEKKCAKLFLCGRDAGLKLHRFKRSGALPRAQKILGTLKGLQPASLLDIGNGHVRKPLIDLFHSYGAGVKIVYTEPSYEDPVRQNADRPYAVPIQVIEKLICKLEVPTLIEAKEVQYIYP